MAEAGAPASACWPVGLLVPYATHTRASRVGMSDLASHRRRQESQVLAAANDVGLVVIASAQCEPIVSHRPGHDGLEPAFAAIRWVAARAKPPTPMLARELGKALGRSLAA
jgi:hypothetical protein